MDTRVFRTVDLTRFRRNVVTGPTGPIDTREPSTLPPGELAYGENENTLYFGKEDGTVAAIVTSGGSANNIGPTGPTGPAGPTNAALLTGTLPVEVFPAVVPASVVVRTGNAENITNIILPAGEIAYTTDAKSLHIGDGDHVGGQTLMYKKFLYFGVETFPTITIAADGTGDYLTVPPTQVNSFAFNIYNNGAYRLHGQIIITTSANTVPVIFLPFAFSNTTTDGLFGSHQLTQLAISEYSDGFNETSLKARHLVTSSFGSNIGSALMLPLADVTSNFFLYEFDVVAPDVGALNTETPGKLTLQFSGRSTTYPATLDIIPQWSYGIIEKVG